MRVLILSAILACAAAAPSAPVLAIAPIIPAALPTLSPGDLQAAAINAKVQAEDQARALSEQARLAAEAAREQAELALDGQKIIAYAAPSAPVIAVAPAPTPGDLQAAAIDSKVQAEDQARALADQERLAADQARLAADQARMAAELARDQAEAKEGQKVNTEEVTSIAKEKSEELFWNVEDKKWQAIDAVKTLEAKLDGAIASNADAIAKGLTYPVVSPLIPYPNLVIPGIIPLVNEKLVKSGDKEEAKKPEAPKLEGANLEVLTPGVGLVGAAWGPIGAPVLYQPGLIGAPVLQQVITPVLKQWK